MRKRAIFLLFTVLAAGFVCWGWRQVGRRPLKSLRAEEIVYAQVLLIPPEETASPTETLTRMVMVDGALYRENGFSDIDARCGVMDGEITSTVAEDKEPAKNDQSNFGTGYGYQYVDKNSIDLYLEEEGWIRFTKR